jgi:predicted RNA binding protein YcfA (HicA-like mRNA interferase family)
MKAVSGKRMCKALAKKGWSLDRIRGSHHIYVLAGRAPIAVPVHGNKALGKGLQARIMKAADLTEDDL